MELTKDRLFFNVFSTLSVNDDLRYSFEEVYVEHVVHKKDKNIMFVLTYSKEIIYYNEILKMEKELKRYLYNRYKCPIQIISRFETAKEYDAKKIVDLYYKKGLLDEWEKRNPIFYSVIHNGHYEFDDEGILTLIVPGKSISSIIDNDIINEFKTTFNYRFDVELDIKLKYDGV
ncbi:MAG: hypothetical protein K5656_03485, partial [Lachnospiraceae bacterium]|nr:hypothetical protein [Lachnospiraceae bacterium]